MAHLRSAGHEVHVLCCDHRVAGVSVADAPGTHRELHWYWRDYDYPAPDRVECVAIERHNAGVLARELRGFRPEVVSWWSMGGMSLSLLAQVRAAGIPSVAFVADDWLVFGPQVDPSGAALGRPPADLDAVTRYVFVSEATRRVAAASGLRLPGSEVVHHGIDAVVFRPVPPRDWSWRLLHAGRLDPGKGVRDALMSLAMLHETPARLTFAGAGDPREQDYLVRAATSLGLAGRVRFTGMCTQPELARHYAAADAVLFPVVREEPWGLVGLEAMACGRPVVATGRGGSGEYLIDGENCLLVEPEQPRQIAAAVRRLAADPALRERLRGGGLATAARFTQEGFNAAVERLLRDAAP
jgi:glycosyltransferase involved in cell wall biosynthesis